ncbi:DinB family protein [uncultured Chryseobacterium sp.]|uniref:DinB family protein n=1 Tax=uncultured Chryseobacterium sp. TaxID=259322 RepID=UPI0025DC6BB1|nr:DinB family protein [uncultured Chryseobacterium sp.]
MSTVLQLAKRFREVLLDGLWIANTNFKDQLSDVTWEQAVAKVGSLNTIAMLTFHIDYYIAGLIDVFEGGDLEIRDRYSLSLPPVESRQQWETLVNKLLSDAEQFASLLEQMPEAKMNEPFANEKYGTYLRNIDGMIEHCYYHLGQITLIKKLVISTAN